MESEIGVQKPKGMMKSKLVMSFYRAAKPCSPPPLQYGGGGDHKAEAIPSHSHSHSPAEAAAAAAAAAAASSSSTTQKVISFNKQRSFGWSDGYVHGPDGGAGDRSVDNKASSYISYVKERRLLEELVATHGLIMDTTNK